MAVTIDSGMLATDDPLSNDLRVSMDTKVAMLDVENSQFTTMLMKLPSTEASSFKEEWMEDQFIPRNTALSATVDTSVTNFPVTTNEGAYMKVGDIVKVVSTGEVVRVSTTGASAVTVVRAIGSVAAASAASGAPGLIIIGGSNEQGATSPQAQATHKTANYNYCQINRTAVEYTNTARWVKWYSGTQLPQAEVNAAIQHKREIENSLFFGAKSYTAGTTAPRCTVGGLDDFISTNITSVAGVLDKGTLQDFLRGALEYGNRSRKVLFAAPLIVQVLGEYLQDNWIQAPPGTTVWGAQADYLIGSAYGARIPVFVKGDWKRYGEGTGNHIGSRAYLVDMTQVELRRAPSVDGDGPRFVALKRNRQANDADELKNEFLSEYTFVCKQEKAHALLKGVSG